VAPLVAAATDAPLPDGRDPARASEGSTAVSAIAATLAITVARPIDENPVFRANISKILLGKAACKPARQAPRS
jgi:hypothetical protein